MKGKQSLQKVWGPHRGSLHASVGSTRLPMLLLRKDTREGSVVVRDRMFCTRRAPTAEGASRTLHRHHIYQSTAYLSTWSGTLRSSDCWTIGIFGPSSGTRRPGRLCPLQGTVHQSTGSLAPCSLPHAQSHSTMFLLAIPGPGPSSPLAPKESSHTSPLQDSCRLWPPNDTPVAILPWTS